MTRVRAARTEATTPAPTWFPPRAGLCVDPPMAKSDRSVHPRRRDAQVHRRSRAASRFVDVDRATLDGELLGHTAGCRAVEYLCGQRRVAEGGPYMRSDTQSITIDAAPEHVVAFVRAAENLPRWAIGFAKEVRRDADSWTVMTGRGAVGLTIETDEARGTVDFWMRPERDLEAAAYSRVLPNGNGAEFVFTQFQQPGTSDEMFVGLVATLGHELLALKALLEVQCPL